jgi:hypothetical protein
MPSIPIPNGAFHGRWTISSNQNGKFLLNWSWFEASVLEMLNNMFRSEVWFTFP